MYPLTPSPPPPPGLLARPLARWHALPIVLQGILLMVLSTVLMSVMHVLIRYISDDLHSFQIVFARCVFGAIVFLPVIHRHGFSFMRTRRLPLHVLRSGLNAFAMTAFFTALAMAPVARVTALGFTAPLFTALIGVLLLGERFRMRRWAAIAVGFAGTLIILRPGMIPLDLGSLLVLGSAAIWGVTMAVIKVLGRTDSALTITGYMTLLLSLFTLGPALWVWQWPSMTVWLALIAIGVTGTLGQLMLTESLRVADSTVVLPFDFLKLVWAAALGFLIFAEVPDLFTWVGAAVVFGSSFYIAYRESVLRRARRKA
ncbi:MAG: DMT family transporter [Pseudomonadota bacterium]